MPPRRRGRSTRASAIRTSTPQLEISDEEMRDAPSGLATPAEPLDDGDDEDADPDVEDADEDAASPALDTDGPTSRTRASRSRGAAAQASSPAAPSPPPQPVKRRPGRPPKNRPVDWDADNATSDNATPKRRGGFRGRSFGGGRWKNRGGPSRVSQVPLDKEGNMATVRDDEVELPEDPEGESKVDKLGYLKDRREYRVRTFTIQGRGDRLYMLSTEPARCIGFRDSYLFFQKHKQLFKIILMDEEKMDLIERDLMPHSYKGRAIGVVTARSVFREFGAKIIIGGKKIFDDYQVATEKEQGAVEGELAAPEDILPPAGQEYNRNQYVAWHGASSVYHTGLPTVPMQSSKEQAKKRKVTVTGINWQFEHAREASRFNSSLVHARRQAMNGVYDIYTNQMHYPAITQPTHARWEQLPTPTDSDPSPTNTSTPIPNMTSLNISTPPPTTTSPNTTAGPNPTTASNTTATLAPSAPYSITYDPTPTSTATFEHKRSTLPPLTPFQARNLLIVDTAYTLAPMPNAPVPGPDGDQYEIGPKGLCDVSEEVVACLPEECREAFFRARGVEVGWRMGWGCEGDGEGERGDVGGGEGERDGVRGDGDGKGDGLRGRVKNTFGGGVWD